MLNLNIAQLNIAELNTNLDALHLLKHPFYQAWSQGTLSRSILADYAQEYYKHVEAFPRYISAIHTQCSDLKSRQVLLGNLLEEEAGEENHPALWANFAVAMGCERSALKEDARLASTQALVDGYYQLCQSSYATGLGALYAYERQVPAVAQSKIDGLIKFYATDDADTLKFFSVHLTADVWHAEECAALLLKLPQEEQVQAAEGAKQAAQLLWGFLDGMCAKHELHC